MPSIEPMLITRDGWSAVAPASSSGRKNLVVWKTPWTLRLRTRSHDAVSCSARGAPQVAPALLTSTSTRPWWAETASANWRAPSSEDRSAAKPEHAPKSDSSATVACTAWAFRDATITVAPAATKPAAIMCPMPRVPPVTTTVFPATEKRSAGGVDKAGSLMASDGSARGRTLLGCSGRARTVAGIGLADRVRRGGPGAHRPDDLRRRVPPGGGSPAPVDPRQRGPDPDGPGHAGTEGAHPVGHLPGGGPLLHRLHRTERRHRSGGASDTGRAPRSRARRPEPDHLHVRGRHQRGPARHHRHGRPRHALRPSITVGGPPYTSNTRSSRPGRALDRRTPMNVAPVNGQQIAYDDTGGGGPGIVLAHGFLMDRTMFAPQVAVLRDDYRVITWDQRGFGDTVHDGRPFTYWDSAADSIALLDHLGIEQAVVGGMSQGGFISLRVALLAPERVRALILMDTQAGTEDTEVIPLYQGMIDEWVANGPSDELVAATAGLILGEPGLNAEWAVKWKARPREVLALCGQALLTRDDITGRLGEIAVPALVVHGTADLSISMDKAEALAAGLPGSGGVVRIEGGTHAANLTHPGPVNEAIVAFVGALPAL